MNGSHWRTVNNFYAILSERSRARYAEVLAESRLKNVNPGSSMPKKELDDLERCGTFLSGDPAQLHRAMFGLAQRVALCTAQKSNPEWGIARATSREFLVNDCFHVTARIPVSPYLYLEQSQPSRLLTDEGVVAFNKEVFKEARLCVFAQNVEKTGLIIDQKSAKSGSG